MQDGFGIELTAREAVAARHRLAGLRDDTPERVALDVIDDDARLVDEIPDRAEMVREQPLGLIRPVFLSEHLIDAWSMQIPLGEHGCAGSGAVGIRKVEDDVAAVIDEVREKASTASSGVVSTPFAIRRSSAS